MSPAVARAWASDVPLTTWLLVRRDVPLAEAAAHAAAEGAHVRVRSRWLHAVSVRAAPSTLRRLARDSRFRRLQPVGRWIATPGAPAPAAPRGPAAPQQDTCAAGGDPAYGESAMPFARLNLRPLADRGYDGAGVRIALLDTGFDTADPAFAGVTVSGQRDFVFGDAVVRDEPADRPGAHAHGTAVWSLLAADVPGRLRGVAPGAEYLLAKTEDIRSETRVEEDYFVAALEWADSLGARIVSTSLGYLVFDDASRYAPSQLNGDVAVTTVAVDSAAARGILVVTSAGNGGPASRSLTTPADADSAAAIGAEDSTGALAVFSSRGPTADGRLKPDFTAPGVSVCVLAGGGQVRRGSGTSFAAPLVAGASALVAQLHPTLDGLALIDALRAHARGRADPDTLRGWGRPNAFSSAVLPRGVAVVEPLPGTAGSTMPLFRWDAGAVPAFAAPVEYRLRIARDSGPSGVFVDTLLFDRTDYAFTRPLLPGETVWWRVDARTAVGVAATTGILGPVVGPAWAVPTALADPRGVNLADPQPTFAWRSPPIGVPPGPFTYDLFVRRPSRAAPDVVVAGLTDTTHRLAQPLERNTTYSWGLVVRAGPDSAVIQSPGTFLILDPGVPTATLLYQNFPNPFPAVGRDATCLWFDLAIATRVELEILDLRGQPVRRFVPGPGFPAVLTAGRYGRGGAGTPTCDPQLTWDGTAADGRPVPPGVYLVRLRAAGAVQFKRIVFRGRQT